MGGATAGHALALGGQRVLFIEKGRSTVGATGSVRGEYAELRLRTRHADVGERRAHLRSAGRATEEIFDTTQRERAFVPFVGSGSGGSSALYGMALERFKPADFTPGRHHPDAIGSSLPAAWPIGHEELEPYYLRAERLYRVSPSAGYPEGPLPPLSRTGEELTRFATSRGLHPYRLPLACDYVEHCSGCQGYLCPRDCKIDSVKACLRPAVERHGAALLSDCEVTRLVADAHSVTGVLCVQDGEERLLKATQVIVAAGAIDTPALLLRSACADHPQGLANASGQVGRNLMRHCIDLYAVFLAARPRPATNAKEFALNDFYTTGSEKFGSLQSFGFLPPAAIMIDDMRADVRNTAGRLAAALFGTVAPLVRTALDALARRGTLLAATMEDLPYADNRVSIRPSSGGSIEKLIHYRLHAHEQRRLLDFRAVVRKALQPYRFLMIKQAENNQRVAHVCGTCRFGDDPSVSVLDRDNKAHGLTNLHVVDASFFPSSGGTNPSLTIAANALRVADALLKAA